MESETDIEAVARAIWTVWVNSEIVTDACRGMTWEELSRLAVKLTTSEKVQACAIAEARAAIAAVYTSQYRTGWLAGRDAAVRWLQDYVARFDLDDEGLIEAVAALTPPEVP